MIHASGRRDVVVILLSFCLIWCVRNKLDFLAASINAAAIVIIIQQLKQAPSVNIAIFWRTAGMYLFQVIRPVYSFLFPESHLDLFLLLLSSIFSFLLVFLFPVPTPCQLPGKFKVATTSFNLQVPGHNFPLPVQCWFPLDEGKYFDGAKTSLLWTSGHPDYETTELYQLLTQLAAYSGFPKFLSSHLLLSRVNSIWQSSFENLTPSLKCLPIAIYSHGMYGWRQVHSSSCEKLASCGFIVFACDHAPDGMVSRPVAEPLNAKVFDYHLPAGYSIEQERVFYGVGLKRRVTDLKYLIDALHSPFQHSPLKELAGRLNYEELNLFGHSFGAGTVTSYCCQYPGAKRVVNLDSWMFPVPDDIQEQGILSASLLNLSAEQWKFGKFQVPFRRKVVERSSQSGYETYDLVIKGTGHQNFCEMHLIASRKILTALSMLPVDHDPHTFADRLDKIILSFFLAKVERGEKGLTSMMEVGTVKDRLLALLRSAINEAEVMFGWPQEIEHFFREHIVHESHVFHDVK